MKEWKFELHDAVSINESGETGGVIGSAEFKHQDDLYLVRFCHGSVNSCTAREADND